MGETTPDGTRSFYAQVRDEGGTISALRRATVVLDRTGPVLPAAPSLWFSAAIGAWRGSWLAATDPHGPVLYKVWYSVNGGPWTVAVVRTSNTRVTLPVRSRSVHVAIRVRAIDALGNWGPERITRR
jgi:hypothetical protein